MDLSRLHGIFPPILTPLSDDQRIDHESLASLVDYLLGEISSTLRRNDVVAFQRTFGGFGLRAESPSKLGSFQAAPLLSQLACRSLWEAFGRKTAGFTESF